MRNFYGIVKSISAKGAEVAAVFVGAMALFTLGDVIGRSFFGMPIVIVDEYCGYLLLGLSFMAFAYTLSVGKQISVTAVTSRLRGRAKKYVALFVSTLALAFSIYFSSQIFAMTKTSYQRMTVSQSVIHTPLFIPQLVMCIGMVLLILQFITLTCEVLLAKENKAFNP